MDMKKTGKFIAECRKSLNLTQSNLAEHFGISDRAVSKWETGKCLPDAGIMVELCSLLKISVNELLQGEKITMEKYEKKADETIVELSKINEITSKRLLNSEIIITVLLVGMLAAADIITEKIFPSYFLLVHITGILIILAFAFYAIRIETDTGYYKCKKCGTVFTPAYNQVLMAPHLGWTRKMNCPGCGKKTWNRKVFRK